MNVEQIAKQTGKSKKHIEFLFTRKRRASPELPLNLRSSPGLNAGHGFGLMSFITPLFNSPRAVHIALNLQPNPHSPGKTR